MMNALGLAGALGGRIRFARLRLWLNRRFFARRHFWVSSLSPLVKGGWCFKCGTIQEHQYPCRTEHAARLTCEPMGDYPNCVEVLSALMFVRDPDRETYRMCDWCEQQVRENLSPILYFDRDDLHFGNIETVEYERTEPC